MRGKRSRMSHTARGLGSSSSARRDLLCAADFFTVDFKQSFLMLMDASPFATCRTRFGKA